MHVRQNQLLCGIVAEYIDTGKPVSSASLIDAMHLSISPATVRIVLQQLHDEGYLYQPHTSAGRVPTDRGFRFYVDRTVIPHLSPPEQQRINRTFLRLADEYGMWTRTVAHLLAGLTNTVAVTIARQPADVQEAGVHELMAGMDEEQLAYVREIGRMVDALDRASSHIAHLIPDRRAVFIGGENPLLAAQHTSLLVRRCVGPDGIDALLILAGAKRMAYDRNLALLDFAATLS